ncbi:DUF6913 domain-containing protein [Chryseosolibacter indicus]|uniref:Uncharacterized protein n=1 Tax=Chryseosolibacter indicus TaxID=2782351 RepID=A0ABS5VKV9_9BACT|nr:hypothetical protein [Chryseosolibacter indicus]MBT1701663.1 hypothetical protein [Chryseosolibacter indicus]
MRHNLLKFKTKRLLKQRLASRSTIPYPQADLIGIVFTAEDKSRHDEIKEFVKKLEQDGKHVKVMTFLRKDMSNHEFLFDCFSEKDLNFWGSIISESANRFAQIPFDFLLYLDAAPNPFTLHLLAKSKAKCRVGKFFEGGEPYFELMIKQDGGLKALIEDIYKYTTTLR